MKRIVRMKKAIVIGATSGIGRAVAQLLTRESFVLGVTGRRTKLRKLLPHKN